MDSPGQAYTRDEIIEGVLVVGFADSGPGRISSEATDEQDVAEFNSRMTALVEAEEVGFTVVDFSNYQFTGSDNGRAVVSSLLFAHRRLKARGGGLLVYNHPAQLNPDLPL